MPSYFLDTSALVKRYAQEQGSAWITNLTDYGVSNELFIVSLAGPEIMATFFRKERGGLISSSEAARMTNNFRIDWQQQYQIVDMSVAVIARAMLLAEKHALRGADSVHIAAALELHQQRQAMQLSALAFVSADIEQLQAAQVEGLAVENPDNYA